MKRRRKNRQGTRTKKDGNPPVKKIGKFRSYGRPAGGRRIANFCLLCAREDMKLKEGGILGKIKPETIRKRVKDSLIEQLKSKGADVDIFTDQINDYMAMWDLKESLKADIEKNGLRMMYKTANGGKAEKDNPSVKQLPAVNKQMLMLLKQMEISTDNAVRRGGGKGDDL